jgi:hypothetical protein
MKKVIVSLIIVSLAALNSCQSGSEVVSYTDSISVKVSDSVKIKDSIKIDSIIKIK